MAMPPIRTGLEREAVAEALRDSFEHGAGLFDDLGTDAVAGKKNDLRVPWTDSRLARRNAGPESL